MKKITVVKSKNIAAPGYLGDKPVAQIGLVLSDGQGTTIFTEICCLIDNEFNSKKIELAEAFADECIARFDDSKPHVSNICGEDECRTIERAKWLSNYLIDSFPDGVTREDLLFGKDSILKGKELWDKTIDYALEHGIIEPRLLFGVKE